MELSRSTALITGASKGLGRALAGELVSRGCRVVLVARGRARLMAAVDEIRAAGGEAHGLVADVADRQAPLSLAAQVHALVGTPDLLIHNASTLGPVPMPLLPDLREGEIERVFEVNVLGPYRLTRAFIGPMLLRGSGLVVTVSSDAAVEAYAGWGAYGASKAALDHLTRILAAELVGSGVQAIAIDPGEMDTDMHRDALPEADPATLARPADVARIIAALLSRDALPGPRVTVSPVEVAA